MNVRFKPGEWSIRKEMQDDLFALGWRNMDSYSATYDYPESAPGVYMIIADMDDTYTKAMVAYVGMSKRLSRRLSNHSVEHDIRDAGYSCRKWFMHCDGDLVRSMERSLIETFDPPWNIVGRRKGIKEKRRGDVSWLSSTSLR